MWSLTIKSAVLIAATSLCLVASQEAKDDVLRMIESSLVKISIWKFNFSFWRKAEPTNGLGLLIHPRAVIVDADLTVGTFDSTEVTIEIRDQIIEGCFIISRSIFSGFDNHRIVYLPTRVTLPGDVEPIPIAEASDTFLGFNCWQIALKFGSNVSESLVFPNRVVRLSSDLPIKTFPSTNPSELIRVKNTYQGTPLMDYTDPKHLDVLICPSATKTYPYVLASGSLIDKDNLVEENEMLWFNTIAFEREWIDGVLDKFAKLN